MIIDFHVHVFEEKSISGKMREEIMAHRRKILSEEQLKQLRKNARIETLLEDMDQAGVDVSVCMGGDMAFLTQEEPELPFMRQNEYIAEAQAKYPKRIVGFFTIDPFRPGAPALLEKGVRELGLKGVKILPS